MSDQLPAPPISKDCDLRGYDFMPLYGTHLFGSEFNGRASDTAWRAAVTLWWAAWNQCPAASLPDDDASLCRLADLGKDRKTWNKIKADALSGFVKCSDGRLYHSFLAKLAQDAWELRKISMEKNENELKRKKRERADRSAMFALLKEAGILLDWNTPTEKLRKLVSDLQDTSHAPVTVTGA